MNIYDIMAEMPDIPLRARYFMYIALVGMGFVVILTPFAFFFAPAFHALIVFFALGIVYLLAALMVKLSGEEDS